MKTQTFSYIVAIILIMAIHDVLGQNGEPNNQKQVQTQDFPSVEQFKLLSPQEQRQQYVRLKNYNNQQATDNAQEPKVTEKRGTFGERDGVVIHEEEGEYEQAKDIVRGQSDGSELGIAHDMTKAGANAETLERQAAFSIDAFQGNDGNIKVSNEKTMKEKSGWSIQELTPKVTPGVDVVDSNGANKIITKHGFGEYTDSFSKSINGFNDNLGAYQAASKQYDSLYVEFGKASTVKEQNNLIDQINKKIGEMNYYERQTRAYQEEAIKYGETISGSTTDGTFKGKIDGFVQTLKSPENNTVNLSKNSKTVSEDYLNLLTKYLPACEDCGNKQ